VEVRPIRPGEAARWDELGRTRHYLGCGVLQLGDVAVEVDTIHRLDLQRHVLAQERREHATGPATA